LTQNNSNVLLHVPHISFDTQSFPKMSSISPAIPTSAVPRGGSPLPVASAPEPPRPLIRHDDAQRLLLNIYEARTTSYATEFESCLDHAYFIVNSMYEANRANHRPTGIFSEMMRLIHDARDALNSTIQTDEDGFPIDYVSPRAVPFAIRLNDKYLELINQTTQIA
jgi:hypothetical protein